MTAPVTAVRTVVYRFPTPTPTPTPTSQADGTLAWDATTAVTVRVDAGGRPRDLRPLRAVAARTGRRRATEVTYLGYAYCTQAVLPRMKARDRGTIVHVGSALAYRGIPLQTAYCGAKHVTMGQMPAVDTPQFSWVLSRLPRHPQPVPPIYQPETVAAQVRYAADHPRLREQIDQPHDPGAPANLFSPVDGEKGHDFGMHGVFGSRTISRDPQLAGLAGRRAGRR